MTWYGLRQQTEKQAIDGVMRPSRCLADFVAPQGRARRTTSACSRSLPASGVEKKEKYFLDDHDDYSAIMLKALADRLAEAFAEALHERVRKDLWGYAPQEALSVEELIAEKYRGIRPAPGYPACPTTASSATCSTCCRREDIGMALTESLAMMPAASVSGFYLSHPDSTYFNVGRIGEDQLQDQARAARRRRGAAAAAAGAQSVTFDRRPSCSPEVESLGPSKGRTMTKRLIATLLISVAGGAFAQSAPAPAPAAAHQARDGGVRHLRHRAAGQAEGKEEQERRRGHGGRRGGGRRAGQPDRRR